MPSIWELKISLMLQIVLTEVPLDAEVKVLPLGRIFVFSRWNGQVRPLFWYLLKEGNGKILSNNLKILVENTQNLLETKNM